MIPNGLLNKNILITGATSGIGCQMASLFSEAGANLVLVGRNKAKLDEMKGKIKGNTLCIPFDLKNLSEIKRIFLQCKENKVILDGLVHSAGMAKNSIVRANDPADIEEVMRVNTFSFIELGKFFCSKRYSSEGASMVAISSIASILNDSGMIQYSTSKAALNSAVKTMANEFLKRKIRVNAILPANVDTELFTSGVDVIENFMETAIARQPLGIIEKEQISYLAEFLLSENAKYITGELITVGGGMAY